MWIRFFRLFKIVHFEDDEVNASYLCLPLLHGRNNLFDDNQDIEILLS